MAVELKKCSRCKNTKAIACFGIRNTARTSKPRSACKTCEVESASASYRKNIEENREKARIRQNMNPEYRRRKSKEWHAKNKQRSQALSSQWHKDNYGKNVSFTLALKLRNRLNKAIKNNQKSGSAVRDIGCSIEELKIYLESKFQPGMSWSNYSRYGWHIDHIEALSRFDLSNSEQLKKACHYTNLQPLWARDNLKKDNR